MKRWRAVWRIQLHRTVPWWLAGLAALSVYVLFATPPLGGGDMWAGALGLAVGLVLAFRLFTDEPGTASFAFSRPLTRSRQFWYRWALGIGLLTVALAFLASLMLTGLRQSVQTYPPGSLWYPMVRPYEVSVLWPIGLASLVGYQVCAFLIVRTRLLEGGTGGRWWLAETVTRTLVLTLVLLAVAVGFMDTGAARPGAGWPKPTQWALLAYLVLLVLATTLAARHCLAHMEIEP